MGPEQQRLYNELRDHYRDSLLGIIDEQGMAKAKMHVLESAAAIASGRVPSGVAPKSARPRTLPRNWTRWFRSCRS